jgi:uncharacterized Zn-binding protein involved in type VI secretion
VSTGFYATARIVGDEVVLDISPRQQQFRSTTGSGSAAVTNGRVSRTIDGRPAVTSGGRVVEANTGPVVETAGLSSTVRGRLGEWFELGAVQGASSGETAGLLVWGRRTASSQYSAWVRVDEVP